MVRSVSSAYSIFILTNIRFVFQCPWPFSVVSKEEATIKEVPSPAPNNTGKKRKKEKTLSSVSHSSSPAIEPVVPSPETESPALSQQDKCKSPNSKKLKLEKIDVQSYINDNFKSPSKESLQVETSVSDKSSKASETKEREEESVEGPPKEISKAEEDAQFFRAVPVAVSQRHPIKLPRHAANIFSSRAVSDSEEREESPSLSGDCELESSALSDPDDSDSELESLVSECSTMTAASETSSLASAGEAEGCGKKKRRGKKKKRKDRRKAHAGKCSKEQPRMSDLSLLVNEGDNDEEKVEKEKVQVAENKTRDSGQNLKIRIKLTKPPDTEKPAKKCVKIKPIVQSKPRENELPLPAMSVTPEDTVSRMSAQSTVSNMSQQSSTDPQPSNDIIQSPSDIPPSTDFQSAMSVSPAEPDSTGSPDTDHEMSDFSKFQFKWSNIHPVSPMSVGDDQEITEGESLKIKSMKLHPPPTTSKTIKVQLSQNNSETENVGFKEPATPTKVKPTSHPSPAYSVPSPKMTEPSKYLSLPNLLSPMAPTPKSHHDEANSDTDTPSQDDLEEFRKKKSSSLDSIIHNLAVEKTGQHSEPHPLPDGPYPRRRGRKSLSKKFQPDIKSAEEDSTEPISKPQESQTEKDGGRPLKKNISQTDESPTVQTTSTEQPLAQVPVKPLTKVIKLVGGRGLPRGLVPCAPPPGAKLVPCSPPSHVRRDVSKTSRPSLFDLDDTDIVGNVQKALERQKAKGLSTAEKKREVQETKSAATQPAKTPSRISEKTSVRENNEVLVATSLSIETVLAPQETSIDLQTLSLANFESDDPNFALLKKVGSGMTFDKELESSTRQLPRLANESHGQESASTKKDNSVVFHVSNQAMINQPTVSNNLEVKEQGETKVMLTADSNLIEIHDLKEGSKTRSNSIYRGRGRGRGVRPVCRFMERNGVLVNQVGTPEAGSSGPGWFNWRDWTVNVKFLAEYNKHIDRLVEKHRANINNNRIDPRISALLLEKQITNDKTQTEKINDFFAEVFVKYLYLKSNFNSLGIESIINIVSKNYKLDNIDFARGIKGQTSKAARVELPSSISTTNTMQLPDNVKTQMIQSALGNSNQAPQQEPEVARQSGDHLPPPPSPSQPINLSVWASEVPLPPSPTSPGPPVTSLPVQVKTEPQDCDYNLGSVQVASVAPESCQVYSNGGCSVQLASVCPTTPGTVVGSGPKILQFFYQNPVDDIKISFPPVRVTTEEEVKCVVALVTEKAEEFNRRNNLGQRGKPVQYYSSAVQARSILSKDIITHIERCFTKKGMKDLAPGRKKRAYPKRKEIIKVPSNYFNKIKQENGDIVEEEVADNELVEEEAEDDIDEVDEEPEEPVVEHIPTESEMNEGLECEVFGGKLPKVKRRIKHQICNLDRKGRGGRNEVISQIDPPQLVFGVVDHLLDSKQDGKTKEGSLNLSSLFKKRSRRKKKRQDVDVFSDEDEYLAPGYSVKSSSEGSRKSKRITMKIADGELRETELLDNGPNASKQSEKENLNTSNIHDSPSVANVTEKTSREKKLEQIREICTEKLNVDASAVSGSWSEDDKGKKVKLKRGMKSGGREVEGESDVSQEDVEEMIRCVSRAASRPSSQASSRPESQLSRPPSALPMKVAKKLEGLTSPERDSPVLTPRMRRKEAIEKHNREALQKAISPRAATPVTAPGLSQSVVSENYLKKGQTSLPSSKTLGNFEQTFTRSKQSEKIRKLLKKQMKKAEKADNKKYQGFGGQKSHQEEKKKKPEKVVKKAQVSKAEVDLMNELLTLGDTAVAEASDCSSQSQANVQVQGSSSGGHVTAITQFEECQTFSGEPQNLSEELDQLFCS